MRQIIMGLIFLGVANMTYSQITPNTAVYPGTTTQTVNTTPSGYTGNYNYNVIRVWGPTIPLSSDTAVRSSFRTTREVKQTTQYFDGLGRPIQTVMKKVSPGGGSYTNAKDMVVPIVYDEFGREVFKYLPYVDTGSLGQFKINPFATEASFMQQTYNPANNTSGEKFFYSQSIIEASPLNRITKSLAPGNSWVGSDRGVSMAYEFNAASEVRLWTISMTMGSYPSSSAYYAANELYRTVTTDEHGKRVVEYKDKEGRVLMKKVEISTSSATITSHTGWLCTYYVYDDLGRLRFVIPPKATEDVISSGTISSTIANELCFRYEYDHRDRMIVKKVPGAWEVHMVYDTKDRLVMVMDGYLLGDYDFNWLCTKYDAFNRPIETYIWDAHEDRSFSQDMVTEDATWLLSFGTPKLLTKTYYDDYSWVSSSGSGLSPSLITTYNSNTSYFHTPSNTAEPYAQAITATTGTLGMVTGTKVNILGSSTYLYNVSFYDDRSRVIQVQSTNYSGGKDTVTSQYDFAGKILRTLVCHAKAGTNSQRHVVLTKMEYDHAGRVLTVKKKTNNSPEVTMSENSYDELGQLRKKNIGKKRDDSNQNTYTSTPLDSFVFSYNIRGWMTGINEEYARSASGANNWFGMELSYDYGFSSNQYNGNISGIRWRSNGSDSMRAYGFGYDAANRLLKADFTQYVSAGSVWNTSAGIDFSMKMGDGTDPSSAYDANGNILKMWQKGLKVTSSAVIDSMIYNYQTTSNKLAKVTDGITADNKLGDFKDGVNSNDDYSYDVNGNMILDQNKKISSILYNHLNLPDSIRVLGRGTIKYFYDATGNKLAKKTVDSASSGVKTTTTTYLGAFVYQNDTLQFAATEEGRVRQKRVGGKDTMYYDYFVKDHLGNVRMLLTDEKKEDVYLATNEVSNQSFEGQIFNNYIERVVKPGAFDSDTTNQRVQRLGSSAKIGNQVLGQGIILKVMAGDKINASVYGMTASGNSNGLYDWATTLSTFFSSGIQTVGGGKGVTTGELATTLNPGILSFLNDQYNSATESNGFLNWIFLDEEQLKYDASASGFEELSSAATSNKVLLQANGGSGIEITKNGFIYLYVSNQSLNKFVYFDDLYIAHERGGLLEETHYYPFGLTQQGISSKAASFGGADNSREFICEESSEDLGFKWVELKYRTHDPQIGRFLQIDPAAKSYVHNSTYAYAENKVIDGIDAEGLEYIKLIHTQQSGGEWRTKEVSYYLMTDNEIQREKGTTAGAYNSAAYGPEGKGVKHIYNYLDGSSTTNWDSQQKDFKSTVGFHGLYSGDGCVRDVFRKYDFSYQPIDWADAIAKRHDEDYSAFPSENHGPNFIKFIDDVRTYQADINMINRVNDMLLDVSNPFKKNYVAGVDKPFRTSTSGEMVAALIGQKRLIMALAAYKKWKIDNGYSNNDTFDKLKINFAAEDPVNAAIIQAI